MKTRVTALILAILISLACVVFAEDKKPQEIKPDAVKAVPGKQVTLKFIYPAGSGYQPDVIKNEISGFEKLHPNIKVEADFPNYDETYPKIVQAAPSGYDVITMDCIWTAEFAAKGYVMPADKEIGPEARKDLTPAVLSAFDYGGHLWGMPFLANFQLLFYNRYHLERAGYKRPPITLEEMEDMMKTIKEKKVVDFPFMDAWNKREGLVCEYVWMTGAYGGELFDDKGNPVFNRGPGLTALETMVRWKKEGLVDPEAINPKNPDADERLVKDKFLSGSCSFCTNWTFQYALMKDSKVSKVSYYADMALIPLSKSCYRKKVIKTSTVSGFQALAVMAGSAHPDEAWEFIKYITRPEFTAANLSETPVWLSVQKSADAGMKDPCLKIKSIEMSGAHHRPKVPGYREVSGILQKYLTEALNEERSPTDALNRAALEIEALTNPAKKEQLEKTREAIEKQKQEQKKNTIQPEKKTDRETTNTVEKVQKQDEKK